jgi:hypothetical protein
METREGELAMDERIRVQYYEAGEAKILVSMSFMGFLQLF